jgi:hypothetical protein
MDRQLRTWLACVAAGGIVVLAAAFLLLDAGHPQDLGFEVGKGVVQLLVVVLLGGAVKLLVDRYQERQRKADQDQQFRQDKYDRLVAATNALRRVPMLIKTDPSVEARKEQLKQAIDAGLILRMIKHQIYSSGTLADPPFPNHLKLAYLFEVMYHYTDWVIADFAKHQQRVSEPPSVGDMRKRVEQDDDERESIQDAFDVALDKIDKTGKHHSPPWKKESSWVEHEEAESRALELITRVTFERHASRPGATARESATP